MNARRSGSTLYNGLIQAALRYADMGYAVFPCAPGQKVPAIEHGLHDATTDQEMIEEWWTNRPDTNVAIRTDGLIVVDIDGAENPWLADIPSRLEELAYAPTAITPRGGRHHIFRQPEGRTWRNTAGRLGPRLDTRANGGYIVVPPSLFNGNTYRWLEGSELDVSPNQLPEPPQWLVEQLDALAVSSEIPAGTALSNAIPEGRRNATLAHLAGTMRRMGMSQAEILAALQQVNADRCTPSLPLGEVERIAASIARYEPNAGASIGMRDRWGEGDKCLSPLELLSAGQLVSEHSSLRLPVISGLLRRGETMNVIAPPKTGKSWLVLSLAICVATGRKWLETFATSAGDVLIVDNELHPETLADRIPRVAASLQVEFERISNSLFFHTSRGRLRDIYSLGRSVESIESGRFVLVVLDAFYRFLPRDTDENSNAALADIYNHIDFLADRLGSSFVLIHHASKGNQSTKAVTDVGAGAGSQSRATDTHLVLRPHAQLGAVVLEAAVRSWPPVAPLALRWSFPLWTPAPDLDPLALKAAKSPRRKEATKPEKPKAPEWTVERFVEGFISEQPTSKAQVGENTKDVPGLSIRRVGDLLAIAESRGLIHRWRVGQSHRVHFATVPQPVTKGAHQ